MIKAKWLYSELPIPLNQLAQFMKKSQYTENSGCGFLLSTSTPSKLVGKYIERVVQKSIIQDPFGVSSQIESISYYICHFNWSSESNYLLILDPPRSLRRFINKLHGFTGLGLVISELNVAPERWLEILEETADSVKILQISSFGIRASQSSTARICVEGTKDVRATFSDMVANKRYIVDSIKFEADFNDLIIKGELTKLGVSRLKTANGDFILEKLRSSLENGSVHNL